VPWLPASAETPEGGTAALRAAWGWAAGHTRHSAARVQRHPRPLQAVGAATLHPKRSAPRTVACTTTRQFRARSTERHRQVDCACPARGALPVRQPSRGSRRAPGSLCTRL